MCKKIYIRNPATSSCKNDKYLGSIIDDSVVTCDEIIDTTKTVPIKTVPTKSTSTKLLQQISIFYLIFY